MFAAPRTSRGRTTARSSSACRASIAEEFRRRKAMTDLSMLQDGVGFTVYRQEEGIERVWPMDPVPRIIPAEEWEHIERGLVQRMTALNLFLKDIYHDQLILRDRVRRPRLVYGATYFRREFVGAPRAARHLHPRLRHRPDPRRRRPVPRARGQLPDAVGRELRAQEPAGDEAGLPAALRVVQRARSPTTTRPPCWTCCGTSRPADGTTRRWCC